VLVAHPVRVALEVAELFVQFFGLDAGQRVLPGGGDDRVDVAGVEFAEAVGQPLGRGRGDEGQVVREVVQVLAGVVPDGPRGEVPAGLVLFLINNLWVPWCPSRSRRAGCDLGQGFGDLVSFCAAC
jgi:hypothetical protein